MALAWARLLEDSLRLDLYQRPELDIVCYFPLTAGPGVAAHRLSAIDAASGRLLAAGMARAQRPVFVSTLKVPAQALARRHPAITTDAAAGRIMRSVLMKPESEGYVPELHARLEELAHELGAGR